MKLPLFRKIMNYIKSQVQEISSYKSLSLYGVFLSFVHVVTFFFWHNNSVIFQYLPKTANSLCWPQIPFCESLKLFSPLGVHFLLYLYLVVTLLTVFLFLNRKTIAYAYWLFLIINLLKLYIFLMDYRLMNSYHYLPFFVSFIYLFIPQKLFFISVLISCFYFWTGLLQINDPSWLINLVFSKNAWFPSFINEDIRMFICLYILCLEIAGSLFLALKNRWRALIYSQFILFYIAGYFIVGYFMSTIFLSLLSLFVLQDFFGEKYKISNIREVFPGAVFISLTLLGSSLPFLIPGETSLTREGRLYALNISSLKIYCNSHIILHFKNKTLQEHFPKYRGYPLSLRCDPYVEWYRIKKICSYYKKDPSFIDLDWSFDSLLSYHLEYKRLIEEKSVCNKNLQYSSWKKNNWIKKIY